MTGIIFYLGERPLAFSERMFALPLSTFWAFGEDVTGPGAADEREAEPESVTAWPRRVTAKAASVGTTSARKPATNKPKRGPAP